MRPNVNQKVNLSLLLLLGNRFSSWPRDDTKSIRDDVIQNLLVTANGVLAVVFAIEWNSDNNPLLLIHNKFSEGVTISVEVFNTDRVAEFADRLNFLTYLVNLGNAAFACSSSSGAAQRPARKWLG